MADFTSKANGNWSATGNTTWNENGAPVAGDDVSIGAHSITVDAASACAAVTFSGAGTLICGANTVTMTSTFTLNATGTLTASTGGISGCTAFTANNVITCTGAANFSVAGNVTISGTYTLSTSTVTITNTSTVDITPSFGILVINASTKTITLGRAATGATVTITAGTLDTSAASNYAFTTTSACNVSGTLTLNGSTVSCTGTGTANGYSIAVASTGIYTGGTGATHTIGSMVCSSTCSVTLTTGNTIINNITSGAGAPNCLSLSLNMTFSHPTNGTITFTYDGVTNIYRASSTATQFYNMTCNAVNLALTFYSGGSFPLTVAHNLTITAGSFTTWDGTNSAALTVTNLTAIAAGTLDCKASTCSFGSGLAQAINMGVTTGSFIGGTGANHTIGSIGGNDSHAYNITLTTGITTFNGVWYGGKCVIEISSSCVWSAPGTTTFTYAGLQTIYVQDAGAIALTTVIINNASCVLAPSSVDCGALTFSSLTITNGTVNTSYDALGVTSRNLTVTNLTSITGTLTCNASTVSLGSGVTSAVAVIVNAAATFSGGTGAAHTYGSIAVSAGATAFTQSTGTTTVNSKPASNFAMDLNVGTCTYTQAGTWNITAGTTSYVNFGANPLNVTINTAGTVTPYGNTTITNNFTITAGTWDTLYSAASKNLTVTNATSITGTLTPNTSTCTFNGAVTVNNGGTLGGNTAWTCDANAQVTISIGGTMHAPTGATFTCYILLNNGTFNSDGGTVTFDIAEGGPKGGSAAETTFTNITFSGVGTRYIEYTSTIITGTLTNGSSLLMGSDRTITITMGTVSAAGAIINNSTVSNYSSIRTIQAASVSYLCVCTGTDWNWDANTGTWNLKWLDYQITGVTGGGGVTINVTGNMTIDAFTVSAGDTLSCTTVDTTITSSSMITGYGTVQLKGTSGHPVIFAGTYIHFYSTGTCDLQYLTATTTLYGIGFQSTFAGTINFDNVTVTSPGQAFWSTGTSKITATNCSFTGGTSSFYRGVAVYNGSKFQLSNCTVSSIGMETSGWLISKNHNGVSNAYRMYGIANYNAADSAYRSGSSDNVTLMNADAYSTAFNTALTYNVAAAAKSLTINASTTATVNALITLTCCTVVNNGTFTLNGVLACGGILFPKYILDADSMLDIGNMIDSGAMIQVMV